MYQTRTYIFRKGDIHWLTTYRKATKSEATSQLRSTSKLRNLKLRHLDQKVNINVLDAELNIIYQGTTFIIPGDIGIHQTITVA